MKLSIFVSFTALFLGACTVLPAKQEVAQTEVSDEEKAAAEEIYTQPYSARYSAELAEQLVENASIRLNSAKVGITNLVGVTGQYDKSSPLSMVLSEQLVQELHSRELSVLDFKATDFIRVTPKGDFALTRDYLELDEIMPITHVLVGTLSHHRDGVMASARLVNINTKEVASVAQVFLPAHVVQQLSEDHGKPVIRKAP
ncbi:FlgO family outer membrane protein [Idiomarina sp. PL1-037]|uniref:FlgO family outer membrane protein n=1 Tax=Idiomarina sp. PL1-037 TaxID=3095365 RepID=UPI002ACBEB87|nr:FlgO family outer membrane protein [Idiomarina sp. PL1-037]WQC53727.1 FlgO family outer membrane protein [Idiomarina sp. PL1-037]